MSIKPIENNIKMHVGSLQQWSATVCSIVFIMYHCLSVTSNITALLRVDLIKRCLSRGMCLYKFNMTFHFLNDVVDDVESTRKSIITS